MKNIWKWFNGKKTFLGLALYFIVGGLVQIGVLDQGTADQFVKVAEVVIGVGVLHKVKKAL